MFLLSEKLIFNDNFGQHFLSNIVKFSHRPKADVQSYESINVWFQKLTNVIRV